MPANRPIQSNNIWYFAFLLHIIFYFEPRFAIVVFATSCFIFALKNRFDFFLFPKYYSFLISFSLILDVLFIFSGLIHLQFPSRGDSNLFIVIKILFYIPYLSLLVRDDRSLSVWGLITTIVFVAAGGSTTAQVSIFVFLLMATALALKANIFLRWSFLTIIILVLFFPLWFPLAEKMFYLLGIQYVNPAKFLARILIWRDAYDQLTPFSLSQEIAQTVNVLGQTERFLHPHNIAFEIARRVGLVPYAALMLMLSVVAFVYAHWDVDAVSLPSIATAATVLSLDYSIAYVWPICFFIYAIAITKCGSFKGAAD